jgi:hypothetical protein
MSIEADLNVDVSAIGGDFFGMHDDHMYHIPSNISTVVDLLEDKGVTWATYQESMPADEFYGFRSVPLPVMFCSLTRSILYSSYSAKNYIIPGSADYPFYVRKHNPLCVLLPLPLRVLSTHHLQGDLRRDLAGPQAREAHPHVQRFC